MTLETDGTWSLTLDVSTTANKVTGSAVLALSNNRVFNYAVTGTYNPRKGTGVLRLKGVSDAVKTQFVLHYEGEEFLLNKFQGRVLGQPVKSF